MRNLLLLLAVFLSLNINAQTAESKAKAKKILDKVSVTTKAFTTISADFTFELNNQQQKVKEKAVGTIKVKGNKYVLKLMGTTTFCNGKTIWTVLDDDEEVNISEIEEGDDKTLNPAEVFTMYEKGFKYSFLKEVFEDTRALYVIDLIPEDPDSEFSRIRLKIDKVKNTVYSMQRFGNNGNIYIIKIKKYTTNTSMSDAMFVFNKAKYPDFDIIDNR
ncbi:MAG: outer membrane lipoprotein carrier protein LolA [Flavobacteriaceae bacterium]|nr:outer membrane lipoprotein carrier protein LolA [Flavobacteriaceae bacterium]